MRRRDVDEALFGGSHPALKGVRIALSIFASLVLSACSGSQVDPVVNDTPPAPSPPPKPKVPLASPVDPALPSIVPPRLAQNGVCRVGSCFLPYLVPVELRRSLPEQGPLMIWDEMIGRNARVTIPPDREVELAGVVVEGSVGLLAKEKQWGIAPTVLQQWHGFRAPGAGVSLVAQDGKAARVILVIAASGRDASITKHMANWSKDRRLFDWKVRGTGVDIIDFTTLPVLSWGDGAYHARIGWDVDKSPLDTSNPATAAGAQSMVMTMLRLSKDAPMSAHISEKSRECLVVPRG